MCSTQFNTVSPHYSLVVGGKCVTHTHMCVWGGSTQFNTLSPHYSPPPPHTHSGVHKFKIVYCTCVCVGGDMWGECVTICTAHVSPHYWGKHTHSHVKLCTAHVSVCGGGDLVGGTVLLVYCTSHCMMCSTQFNTLSPHYSPPVYTHSDVQYTVFNTLVYCTCECV